MVLLDNDQFLSRLTLMFDRSRAKGEVRITMKRYDGRTKPVPKPRTSTKKNAKTKGKQPAAPAAKPRSDSTQEHQEFSSLVRAIFKHEKISSVIHAKDMNKFQQAFCALLRSNMDGLKRQKKQKLKKSAE